jgi:hypothetical protein
MTVQAFNPGGPPPSDESIRRGRRRRLALLAWLWPDPLQDGALGGRGAVSRIFGWASFRGAGGTAESSEDEAWRGRRRRLTLLAWLWPSPLQDGALGGRGAGSRVSGWASFFGLGGESELSEDELWRGRRRRLALLLALLAGLAFAPGLMIGDQDRSTLSMCCRGAPPERPLEIKLSRFGPEVAAIGETATLCLAVSAPRPFGHGPPALARPCALAGMTMLLARSPRPTP